MGADVRQIFATDLGQTHDIGTAIPEPAQIKYAWGMQRRDLFGQTACKVAFIRYAHQKEMDEIGIPPNSHAVRDARFRLSVLQDMAWGELYDLETDPGALRNLRDDPVHAHNKARPNGAADPRGAGQCRPLPHANGAGMTRWLDHKGVGLHWREDGDPDGAPLLLLNSLGTDLRLWDGILPQLSAYRVIRMDTRGHGLSDAPDTDYTLAMLVEDAAALIDHLRLQRLSVIGVSLGGMMAQALAARMPDLIARLVLSNTALRSGTDDLWSARMAAVRSAGLESIADAVLDRWFASAFRDGPEIGIWRNMLTRTPAQGYIGCCAALAKADLSAISTQIACPTLVIAGSEDGASPPDIVRTLAEAIRGATYREIGGVGHLPMAEAPDQLARLISDFLKEPTHA